MPQFRPTLLALCLAFALPGAALAAVTYQFVGTFTSSENQVTYTTSFTVVTPTPITTPGFYRPVPGTCAVSPAGGCFGSPFFGPEPFVDTIFVDIEDNGVFSTSPFFEFPAGAFLANGVYTTARLDATLTVRGIADETPVPAPMSLAVLGAGLIGLAALRRRG